MICNWKKDNKCPLLTLLIDPRGFYVPDRWCENHCGPGKYLAMLKRHGVQVRPPEGVDLLEWIEAEIAAGKVKLPDIVEQRRQEAERRKAERQALQEKMNQAAEELPNGLQ